MRRIVCLIVAASLVATVAYAEVDRVLIADPDPGLERAVETTLAPWRMDVVVEPRPPADIEDAKVRAVKAHARFVVWRHGRDLLVYDRDRDAVEQRATTAGTLDATRAAQAALTVKTLMRLPPPPGEQVAAEPVDAGVEVAADAAIDAAAPPVERAPLEVRVQVGGGAEVASAGATGRGALAATVRRWGLPLRLGIAGELGTRTSVDSAGFKGDFSHWSLLALASWALPAGRLEVEPFVAGGLTRTVLDGTESSSARREAELLGTVRGGAWIRVPLGRFSVGGTLAADFLIGTPTYTKLGGGSMNTVFEVPGFAFTIGAFAAADFAP